MEPGKLWRIILNSTIVIIVFAVGIIGFEILSAFQSTPNRQYTQARGRWEASTLAHYRMVANYFGNFAQCYYDIEVKDERIVHAFSLSCISSAESKTLTVSGIFKNFEPYVAHLICSVNGCYCEGTYVLKATYNQTLGYPESITTVFHRDWTSDLLHGKLGAQQCLRTDPLVEKFEVVKVTILP